LTVEELFNITWGNYVRVCFGEIKKDQNLIRHTRLILGALTGKDPRELIPMKGDYDHLKVLNKEQINSLLMKWNKTEWLS
jgi:hypothetical protein